MIPRPRVKFIPPFLSDNYVFRSFVSNFAAAAHEGQVRKFDGRPYIEHPRAVEQIVAANGGTENQRIAALLHDVVEDTEVTLEEIRRRFGDPVAEIVDALTRREGEAYVEFVERAATAAEGKAWLVKRSDVLHNLSTLPPGHPLHHRYIKALEILHAHAPKESQ